MGARWNSQKTYGLIARSTDRGLTWTTVPDTTSIGFFWDVSVAANGSWALASVVSPKEYPTLIPAGYQVGGLYRSSNAGLNFSLVPNTVGPTSAPYDWVGVECGKASSICLAGK